MKRQTITLDYKSGPKDFEAWCEEGLSIHKNEDGTYTVSHIQSGSALFSNIKKMRQAKTILQALIETGVDFTQPAKQVAHDFRYVYGKTKVEFLNSLGLGFPHGIN